jgi:hypothetical protein
VSATKSLAWPAGSNGGTDETYIDRTQVYTDKVYCKQVLPENGYTGTVQVRNAAGTGIVYLTYVNGILTGVA